MESTLYFILFGAIAGWLAGLLMKGSGFGLLGNILLGILGGLVGGWLFSKLGISMSNGLLGSLITAVVGGAVIVFIAGLFKR